MKTFELKRIQVLPISPEEAWVFFSDPGNLGLITPPHMKFEIIGPKPEKIAQGQIIEYKVNILPLIRVKWITEITVVHPPFTFIDEQRNGPYTLWRHQHHFRPIDGGVEMTDEVSYAIPFGILGQVANWLFVGRQVSGIFDYRNNILKSIFSKHKVA